MILLETKEISNLLDESLLEMKELFKPFIRVTVAMNNGSLLNGRLCWMWKNDTETSIQRMDVSVGNGSIA